MKILVRGKAFYFMNPFNVTFECIFQTKTLLANVAQVLFDFFMYTYNVSSEVFMLES